MLQLSSQWHFPRPGASRSSPPNSDEEGIEPGSGVPRWRISAANHRHKTIWCGEMIDANTHFKHRQLNSCRQAPRLEFRAQLLGSDKVQNQSCIPRCYLIMKMWWLMLLSRGYNLPVWRFSAPKSSIPPFVCFLVFFSFFFWKGNVGEEWIKWGDVWHQEVHDPKEFEKVQRA